MKHIVIDIEMNTLAKQYMDEKFACGREVIEIGAVVLDDSYQEIGAFKTLVKPQYNDVVAPHISKMTGITTEMVSNAPVFEDGLKLFLAWCRGMNDQIKIYQWSGTDIDQITREIKLKDIALAKEEMEILMGWEDFQKEFGNKLNLENAVSLKNATMYAGVEFEGREHDALDDARNTAALLRIVRDSALCKKALKNVIDVLTPSTVNTALGSMFDFRKFGFSA